MRHVQKGILFESIDPKTAHCICLYISKNKNIVSQTQYEWEGNRISVTSQCLC